MKAKKPFDYTPNDLQGVELYSMILNKRTASIPSLREMSLLRKAKLLTHKVINRIAHRLLMI